MSETGDLARRLVEALAAKDRPALEALLDEDARLRLWGWQGVEAHRPRDRVAGRLAGEWASAAEPVWEVVTVTAEGERAVVEFRVQLDDPGLGRYVEHNRALVAQAKGDRLYVLDLYCAEPVPSGPRRPPPAPADISLAELHRLFELSRQSWDLREAQENNESAYLTQRLGRGLSDSHHPAGNFIGGARVSEAQADALIEGVLTDARAGDYGLQWWVTPYDRPADLPERLERHGLVRAGGYEKMVRWPLADLSDIPINPQLAVEPVDGSDEAALAAALDIVRVAFAMPDDEAERFGQHWRERMVDPTWANENLILLARLDGQPAGTARIILRGPMGYLVAGSTLPAFRHQRVYSTLLRRRLEAARERGYNIVALDAGPMSRAVVERYGFKPHGTTHIYAWMPVMDMEVIRKLVPSE